MKKIIFILWSLFFGTVGFSQKTPERLPRWQEGYLDIHHINTGRGDAAFAIFPDGTSLLIDAGDMSETHPRTLSVRNAKRLPNTDKSAPEWIVDYIQQFHPNGKSAKLDYALITHYHDDHFGEVDSLRQIADGGYQLTGITAVGSKVPIGKLIDRGFSYPLDLKSEEVQKQERFTKDPYGMVAMLKNYWKFIDYQSAKNGLLNQPLKVGGTDQIVLQKQPDKYPKFVVRNIASNGVIWTGEKEKTTSLFQQGDYPGENPLSNCIKITYGGFDYFTGGDISGINGYGETDDNSLESNLAPVIGPVDVSVLNHHGNRDSQNIDYVRTLRPSVWIQQNWSSDHPGEEVLRRITSTDLYPGERAIFSTVMLQPNKDVIGNRLNQYKSQQGHIVLRVYPQGKSYEVFILDDTSTTRGVIAKHGPYESR